MKAPVKMVVPTGLFIFPSVFIVIIGPAMITIFTRLRPLAPWFRTGSGNR